MITRVVTVDRSRTPREVLTATGFVQHIDNIAVDTMPRGEGEEVEVIFFPYDKGYLNVADLPAIYEAHGLKPDPYALAALNEADPGFADFGSSETDRYVGDNACYWQSADGALLISYVFVGMVEFLRLSVSVLRVGMAHPF